MAQRIHGPGDRSGGELGPHGCIGMFLGSGRDLAGLLGAAPDPPASPHQHRSPEARGVVEAHDPAAVADRDDTAGGAPLEDLVGLDVEHEVVIVACGDGEDVEALDTDEVRGSGRTRARRDQK